MIRDEDANYIASLNCPVCLQPFDDKVALGSCFHAFCRFCILQWSEFEPARRHGINHCPLCRTSFSTLIASYSAESQSYDIYHMEEDEKKTHWSQVEANEDAIHRLNEKAKKEAVIRQRRLFIYSNGFFPNTDFKIPLVPSDLSRQKTVLNKVMAAFNSKGRSFLEREIPILLLHSNMKVCLQSLKTQDQEVELVIDLIKALLESALPFLMYLVSQRSCSPISTTVSELIELVESLGVDATQFNVLSNEISPFFGESTFGLLYELTCFILSPYSLEYLDTSVEYLDPQS